MIFIIKRKEIILNSMDIATFGAGCFWGVEKAFQNVKGVINTQVGYCGGYVENPSYEMVCKKTTGHAEVVQVEFNPIKVSYDELLKIFWSIHDPTSINRQGLDVNDQYRSVIFYHNLKQKKTAEKQLEQMQKNYEKQIVTEIKPFEKFYLAEEYHQKYLDKKKV
jgi:peptide-methionine (S)-S-oxide reductase